MAGMTKRTEFSQALKAIASERGLDAEIVIDTIKQAYVAAYKRDAKEQGVDVEELSYDAEIDPVTGEAKILSWAEDTPDDKTDVTPPGFGRIAAQTAKQVIHQKIREAEKGAIMDEFTGRIGNLISGTILRFDGPDVRVDIGRTEAIMSAQERITSERLTSGIRLTFLLKSIEEGPRGKQIMLSRADTEFVKKVFAREVPEINSGSVEIREIAREPGVRTKIAVHSSQPGVDPVGSCVGQKGVRVQAVTNELGGERVDIVPWAEDPKQFIASTLAPVEVDSIELNEEAKTAIVRVPEDQLSLTIGKEGGNVRLSSQLTGYRIEAEGIPVEGGKSEASEAKSGSDEKKVKKTKKAKKVKTKEPAEEEKSEEPEEKVEEDEPKPQDQPEGSDADSEPASKD